MNPWENELQSALAPRYRLIDRLGQGGTAVVYRAEDTRHDRQVAVKVLRPEIADGITLARFQREIALVARLTHPNILTLLDSGDVAGLPYFVMPYVSGETLAARLKHDRRLVLDDAVRLGCEIADALDYANAAGVVHRDIKPENILLIAGHAVVTDFSAARARALADQGRLTQTGIVIGTMQYMSPEQAAGERELDGRSDEYSLAVMVHEMLAGTLPFEGASARAVMAERFVTPPIPLRRLRPDVPRAIEATVLRALAPDPAKRFRTVGEFGTALQAGISQGAPLPTIAVTPFSTVSNEHDDEVLAFGIAEEITTALGRLRALRVTRVASPLAARKTDERLDATALLEGTLQRAEGRLHVTARLVSASDGRQLWAEQFTRESSDVFSVQEEIARAVVHTLEVQLLGQSQRTLVAPLTQNLSAHDAYLRGRFAWNKRTEAQLSRSVTYFEQAIAADRDFAAAHAALADGLLALGVYSVRAPGEVMPAGRRAAQRALELDPTSPDAHTTNASISAVYDWNWIEADEGFRRAIRLDLRFAPAHHAYAVHVLAPTGRHDEALVSVRRAALLEPLSAVYSASIGIVLFAARRYGDAIRQYESTLELEPNFGLAHYFMGQSLAQLGELPRAIVAFERAIELSGRSSEIVSALAHAHAVNGDSGRANALFDELCASGGTRYVSPYLIAQVYCGLGRYEDTLTWLEKAARLRACEMTWIAVRAIWDPLRGHEGFAAIEHAVMRGTGLLRGSSSATIGESPASISPRPYV